MNRTELYANSIDTLKEAYFKHELKHNDCKKCAVGNLLKEPAKQMRISAGIWSLKFVTSSKKRKQYVAGLGEFVGSIMFSTTVLRVPEPFLPGLPVGESMARLKLVHDVVNAEMLISKSGYTQEELAQIEFAFETAERGETEEDYMFNGLMAVIDVLDQIHDNTDAMLTNDQKKRFLQLA